MTVPKIRTVKRGGSRFYVHPDKMYGTVPGVTSVINMLPKPWLRFWAAKMVAEAAVDNTGWMSLAMTDRDGAVDYLKRAPFRNTSKAADMGTDAHDLWEKMARGETLKDYHPDLVPFVKGFQQFLDLYEPEFLFVEETVWSEKHGYAGSFDSMLRISGDKLGQEEDAIVVVDNKTTKSGIYPEVGLQLNAYARADYILREDGSEVKIPDINAAAVFHCRPEGWSFVPVRLGDDLFSMFCSMIPLVAWEKELKPTVLGPAIHKEEW